MGQAALAEPSKRYEVCCCGLSSAAVAAWDGSGGTRGIRQSKVCRRVTMEILRHANIRITQEIYTHVQDGMKREALDALSRVFEGLREAA